MPIIFDEPCVCSASAHQGCVCMTQTLPAFGSSSIGKEGGGNEHDVRAELQSSNLQCNIIWK